MGQNPGRADIALVVTTLGRGGTERYVQDLAIAFTNHRLRALVVVDSEPLIRFPSLVANGVIVECLGVPPHCPCETYSRILKEVLARHKPRLIHVCAWLRYYDIVRTARDLQVPVIETRHRTDELPRFRDLLGINRSPFGLYRERARARRYSVPAISISKVSQSNLVKRWNGAIQTMLVYNGIPASPYTCSWGATAGEAKIAWVGSMIERKRPFLALQVFERVRKIFPNVSMIMLGDGPLRPSIADAARTISNRIQVIGYCESVLQMLAESHVYLQTSAAEGLAYSIIEAMSVGLPAVATNVGATAEAVVNNETGFLAPHNDAETLAHKLLHLIANPALYKTFGSNALQKFNQQFTLGRMVQETLHAYELLCNVRFETGSARKVKVQEAGCWPIKDFAPQA
jgi:glycosyltransferase involved in cell wall biosynthesis